AISIQAVVWKAHASADACRSDPLPRRTTAIVGGTGCAAPIGFSPGAKQFRESDSGLSEAATRGASLQRLRTRGAIRRIRQADKSERSRQAGRRSKRHHHGKDDSFYTRRLHILRDSRSWSANSCA